MDPAPLPTDQHLMVVVYAAIAALFTQFICYQLGFYKRPEPRGTRLGFFPVFVAFFLFFAFQVLIAQSAYYLAASFLYDVPVDQVRFTPYAQAMINFAASAMILAVIMAYLWTRPRFIRMIWGGKEACLKNLGLGIFLWFAAYPPVLFVGESLSWFIAEVLEKEGNEQVPVRYLKSMLDDPLLFIVAAGGVTVLIPLLEELLFRGFLQTALVEKLGLWGGIIFTSLIFSFFHYSPTHGVSNFQIIPCLFFLSCLLGYLYERQGSLWAPIGLHMSFNGVSIAMLAYMN